MTAAYPLQWPDGWPRTPPDQRGYSGRFRMASESNFRGTAPVSLETARRKLMGELGLMGATNVVLSTNIRLRADGHPRSDDARIKITEPGAAIYFTLNGQQFAMACDRFDMVAGNVRSLGLAIEAMRQLERHGGGAMMQRAFSGFTALPPPRSCWEVLGVTKGASPTEIDRAWRAKAKAAHPDLGGSPYDMAEVNRARDEALRGAA